jgi:hypothetical protein
MEVYIHKESEEESPCSNTITKERLTDLTLSIIKIYEDILNKSYGEPPKEIHIGDLDAFKDVEISKTCQNIDSTINKIISNNTQSQASGEQKTKSAIGFLELAEKTKKEISEYMETSYKKSAGISLNEYHKIWLKDNITTPALIHCLGHELTHLQKDNVEYILKTYKKIISNTEQAIVNQAIYEGLAEYMAFRTINTLWINEKINDEEIKNIKKIKELRKLDYPDYNKIMAIKNDPSQIDEQEIYLLVYFFVDGIIKDGMSENNILSLLENHPQTISELYRQDVCKL